MPVKVTFRESRKCYYCARGKHLSCTKRFPVIALPKDQMNCICWVWAGKPNYHEEEITNMDDAIINILGNMSGN